MTVLSIIKTMALILMVNMQGHIQKYGLGEREGVGSHPLLSPRLSLRFPFLPPIPVPSP